jgi:hypothetical protein
MKSNFWTKTVRTSRTGVTTTVWRPRLHANPISQQEQTWLIVRRLSEADAARQDGKAC